MGSNVPDPVSYTHLLFNELVYNTITLSTTRASHADASPLRVYDVGEPVVPLFVIVKFRRQIYGCLLYTSQLQVDHFPGMTGVHQVRFRLLIEQHPVAGGVEDVYKRQM